MIILGKLGVELTFVPIDILPSLSASDGSFLCFPLKEILAMLPIRKKQAVSFLDNEPTSQKERTFLHVLNL